MSPSLQLALVVFKNHSIGHSPDRHVDHISNLDSAFFVALKCQVDWLLRFLLGGNRSQQRQVQLVTQILLNKLQAIYFGQIKGLQPVVAQQNQRIIGVFFFRS